MNINIKTILIAAGVSLVVSALSFFGLIVFMQSVGVDALSGTGIGNYIPERVIIKETAKEPRAAEKYVPQTTEEQMIVAIVKKIAGRGGIGDRNKGFAGGGAIFHQSARQSRAVGKSGRHAQT